MLSMEAENQEIALKPFYVYELVDPRDSKVFYVGKGKGERALQHVKEANKSDKETKKLNKIREVEGSGESVIVRVIGRYDSSKEALAVESTLIHWVYGYGSLTNKQGGHGGDTIRPRGNLDEIQGVDIRRKVNAYDGEYSKQEKERREANGIVAFMREVKAFVERQTGYELDELDTSDARFTRIAYSLKGVKIIIGTTHSATRLLYVQVKALDGKRESKARIVKLCEQSSSLEEKAGGEYAILPNCSSSKDFNEIVDCFLCLLNEVQSSSF